MRNAHVLRGLQRCQGKEGMSLASLLPIMLEATYGIEIADDNGIAALVFDPAGMTIAVDRDLRFFVTDTLAQAVTKLAHSGAPAASQVNEWHSTGAIEERAARILYRRLAEERAPELVRG